MDSWSLDTVVLLAVGVIVCIGPGGHRGATLRDLEVACDLVDRRPLSARKETP